MRYRYRYGGKVGMNLTLHLTDDCNMRCSYCVHEKRPAVMSEEVLYAACELAFSEGKSAGVCFFGGEPLLEKELIYKALSYCNELSEKTGKKFFCKITTNGTLLDEKFLDIAAGAGMEIGISFDGLMQDKCRVFADGGASFALMEEKARLLLGKIPSSYVMMTVAPQAVGKFSDSVRYLYALGFERITAGIAYGKKVRWTDADMDILRAEFEKISIFYEEKFLEGKHFFFSPFDSKIRECISGYDPSERCHLGLRQTPVSPDGKIYPCTQFIGDKDYCLGDVFTGIDKDKRLALARKSSLPALCAECEIKNRCTNSCGCLNRLETGDENAVSPLQCTYERMLIGTSDALADRLVSADRERFMKKFAD